MPVQQDILERECPDLSITGFEETRQDQPREQARSQYLAELQSLEMEYRNKLQDRKTSLEQAEAELLEADKQARMQLIERRKQHHADMRALDQSCKEELDRCKIALEQENASAISRWQAHLQAKLECEMETMQATLKQRLEELKARTFDGFHTQVASPKPMYWRASTGHLRQAFEPYNGGSFVFHAGTPKFSTCYTTRT
jgi:hypothetical protein